MTLPLALLKVAVPAPVFVIVPLYFMMRDLGLLGSLNGLIIVYIAAHLPFSVFVLTSFFASLPKELEEAAFVDGAITEAELAKRLFENLGVPAGRLVTEDRSRDTDENAKLSKAIADPKPGECWLLVTSGHHMPRAVGAFRRAGFPVEAYPVDWRTRGPEDLARPFRIASDGLKRTDTAVHEWVGLLVYWLSGRTSELFPGPR